MARVLLITYDRILAHAYRTRLTRSGFDVEHCRTAPEGLVKAEAWFPAIILLDLMLPGVHGLEALKLFRDMPSLVKVRVVLLIERTLSPELLDECLLWSGGTYLHKDVCSLKELVAHLHLIADVAPFPATTTPTPSA